MDDIWEDLFEEENDNNSKEESVPFHVAGGEFDNKVVINNSESDSSVEEKKKHRSKPSKKKQKKEKKKKKRRKERKGKKGEKGNNEKKPEKKTKENEKNNKKKPEKAKKQKKTVKKDDNAEIAPNLPFEKGLDILTKYHTVGPNIEGTEIVTPVVLINWLPPKYFNAENGDIKAKGKNPTKIKKAIQHALKYLNKPELLKNEVEESSLYWKNLTKARKALAGDSDPNKWGFSILDLIGVDTRWGYPRLIVSWFDCVTQKVENKTLINSILKEETFWMKHTLGMVGDIRLEDTIETMERFINAYSQQNENQKDKTSLVFQCWPTWETLVSDNSKHISKEKGNLLFSVNRWENVPEEEEQEKTGYNVKKYQIPPFPLIHMPVAFGKFPSSKQAALKELKKKSKKKSSASSKGKIDPKSLLPPQPMSVSNIDKAILKNQIRQQPWIKKNGNEHKEPEESSEKMVERACYQAVQQIKSFFIIGPQIISDKRRRLSGVNPDLIEEEKLRQKLSDSLSQFVKYKHNQLHKGAIRHLENGRKVLVVDALPPAGVGAFLQNPLAFTKRYGRDGYAEISQLSEWKGNCFLTPYKTQQQKGKRKERKNEEKKIPKEYNKKNIEETPPTPTPSPVNSPRRNENQLSKEEKTEHEGQEAGRGEEKEEEQVTESTPKKSEKKRKKPSPSTPEEKIISEENKRIPGAPTKKQRNIDEFYQREKYHPVSPNPILNKRNENKHTKEQNRKDEEEKALSPSPIWKSFNDDDISMGPFKDNLEVFSKGQADESGRISNFAKVLLRNSVRKNFTKDYKLSMLQETKEISEKAKSVKVNPEREASVIKVITKNPNNQCEYTRLLLSQTLGAHYIQKNFDEINCVSTASIWVRSTCKALDILRMPHYNEKRQLPRFYTAAQLIIMESLKGPVMLMAKSRLHKDFETKIICLKAGSIAIFSRDITVDVVGRRGTKLIPARKNRNIPEMDNSHEKYIFVTYVHAMPKPIDGF